MTSFAVTSCDDLDSRGDFISRDELISRGNFISGDELTLGLDFPPARGLLVSFA